MKKRVLSLFLAITLCLTLTPTGALAAEGQPPEQTVSVTQEAQIPAPALEEKEEEKTTPAQTGAGENASPANPEENPTENAPAAAEKNTEDKGTGKEAGQNEPTAQGENEPLALGLDNAGQNAAEGENGEAGDTSISEEDTRTEIRCIRKPSLIQRGYDGTKDGSTIRIDLTFTDDGTNEIKLTEGTGFTAKKTFDSADAGKHTVTVEIKLIGDAAAKYKLKAGEETFTIGGYIDKAYPDLNVSLSKAACTVGERILPLLSVEGAPEGAAVTYYYTPIKTGYSEFEGSNAVPKIDENTAISEPGTYYVYAKTAETKNYKEERSTTAELTVNEAVVEAASVTKADGKDGGTYESLPAALNAAQDGDTVKLLADHVTDADALNALGEDFTFEQYASIVPVVTKTLTLDLNHKTVDYLDVGFSETDEETQEKKTLATGNLTVTGEAAYGRILSLMFMGGTLDILGGEIGGSEGAGLVCDANSGPVTVSNGTVYGLTVLEGAAVTVKNGFNHRGRWSVDSGGTLSITGGTFKDVQFVNSGTIAISGGTFEKISNNDTNTPQPLMLLLAKDCAFVNENNTSDVQDGTKTSLTEVMVKEHTHTFENGKCDCGVAAIVVDNNNSFYNTLQAALGAAADDASITSVTLGQDLTEDVMFSGSAAGSLTLNMNGHKLETEAGVPLTVTGGTLRIEGAGGINQNTASNATAFPAISLTGGKLVIAGDLTAQGGYDSSSGRKPAIYATGGELDLQGNVSLNGGLTILDKARLTNLLTKGTFYVDASETGNAIAITDSEVPGAEVYKKALDLLAKDYAFYRADGSLADAGGFKLRTGTYTIKSHTCNYTQDEAHGMAYCKCGRSHAHRDLSEEKSVLVNGICPICGYHCPHNNIGDDGVCTDCHAKMVAKVTVGETTTYTADLADALNKAANGTTITLLANTMLPSDTYVSKTLTLDLDGHSLSGYSLNIGGLTPTSQVRTGNLTVIDSSGGNGAVGVTVRDGGTLVFDPKNDHTTLLQLEVWGGTVELYGGKISRSGLRLNNSITLGNLLPQKAGLAYYRDDTQLTQEEAASQTCDLVVKSCSHGGKNGFDNNFTACPYCGAPAVAETGLSNGQWKRFADLQTAIDADRDGGAEFKLLTDVTGNYTINGTQDTGLDLNGHSIKGTVTVKGIKGDYITTTLSNTQNTTTASIDKVVAFDGAELAGSGFPAVIGELTLADGATWKNILNLKTLGYKVLNADGTHKWYAQDGVSGSQLNNVIINRLPITSKNLSFKVNGTNVKGNKAERGTTVQLCAYCNAKDADVSIYIGETVGNSLPTYRQKKAEYKKIGTSWYYVVDLDANTIGTYDIYFTASKDGYKVMSSHKTLTVTKPDLRNAVITFPYGNEAAFNSVTATGVPTFDVIYKGQTLKKDVDYTIASGDSFSGVGPCTLTIKATDNGDYTGSKSAEWTVRPLKVAASVGDIIKTYDGTTDLPANTKITFTSADSYYTGTTLRLAKGTDYEVSNARYDSADAGQEKTVSFTIKLKNEGYVFEDGTKEKAFTLNGAELNDKTFQINKAAIASDPQLYQTVFNDLEKTYEIDLNQALNKILPEGCTYGDIQYGKPGVSMYADYYPAGGATIGDGKLSLFINKAASFKQGKEIGTVTVQVETTNYQPFTLTIHVSVQDKLVPVPAEGNSVSAKDITYGQTLADSKLTVNGTMKDPNTGDAVNGTFTWTDGTITPPNAGDYKAEWTFTPAAGYEEYAPATGTVTVKVNPAKLTVSVKASSMLYYTGKEQIASIIASGESVDGTPVTFTYSDKENGIYTSEVPAFTDAGTYTAYYKAEAANHEPATGTFTVTIKPLPISLRSVSSISKTYDGSADVTLTADKLTFFSNTTKAMNIKLPNTALTFSNAQFTKKQADRSYLPSPEVGGGKALSFTMTLTSKNYVFEGESEGTTEVSDVFATDDANWFTITKAAAPTDIQTGTLNVINGTQQTYTYDFSKLLPELSEGEYGTISYGNQADISLVSQSGYYYDESIVEFKNGVLTLAQFYAKDGIMTGEIGTVKVKVTTTNYEDFQLTLVLNAVNQIDPEPNGRITATPITYGNELSTSAITGTMQDPATGDAVNGTFTWDTPAMKLNAGSHDAKWTFTPDESYGGKYTTNTGTATVTVAKRGATVTPDNKSKVYQEKDPELTYIVSGVLSGETLKGITLARAEGENAGQYAITATADAGANPNYEVTFAKGTLTIEPKSIKGAKVVLGKGLTANGAEQTQTVEKVLLDDKEIPADSYTVAGNTATAPGRYTLTVTAKGNYTDSVEQIYAIAYKDTAVPSSSKPSSNNSSNDSETKKNEVAAPTPAPTPASTSKPSTITAMPQTGDTSNPTLYVVLLVASLLGLAVVFVCKKRNDK